MQMTITETDDIVGWGPVPVPAPEPHAVLRPAGEGVWVWVMDQPDGRRCFYRMNIPPGGSAP